jgi:hypothetical protein
MYKLEIKFDAQNNKKDGQNGEATGRQREPIVATALGSFFDKQKQKLIKKG